MQASINTAVYLDAVQSGTSQFQCLKTLVDHPIDDVEVRGELFDPKTRDQELFMIKTLCTAQNWDLYFSIPEQLFDHGQVNEHLSDYLAMASTFGIKGLKISLGDAQGFDVTAIAKLHRLLSSYSGTVTVENQPNAFSRLPAFSQTVHALLEAVPTLGYTFDSGNWYWLDETPANAFAQLKDVTTVFHLKDIKNRDTVMLGDGDTDWVSLVDQLDDNVPVFLEYAINDHQFDAEVAKLNAVLAKR
jgi:sugar phosphate isomerase/epimerase